MFKVIGISAFFHDSSAALLIDGKIINAVQEERFTRIKHDSNFPINCIRFILKNNKLKLTDIDKIIFFEKPFLKFERLIETYIHNAPRGFNSFRKAMPIWIKEKLFQKKLILDNLKLISNFFDKENLLFCEHHLSHAASAFYPSPFQHALILTVDGVGENATTTVSIGKDNKIELIKELNFPNSLGLLYSAFTYYLGFKVNSGEYKVMGLAPYGKPKYEDIIYKYLIDIKKDGSFRLNQKYFSYSTDLKMINKKFENLFDHKTRIPENNIDQFHMDIAASIQKVTENIMIKLTRSLHDIYKIDFLCLAGGGALNCVVNGKILEDKRFKKIWIQPAAGDAGTALGAALYYWYNELGKKRNVDVSDSMKGSFLGPSFRQEQIIKSLNKLNAKYDILNENEIIEKSAKYLSEGKALGWFNGCMEFGPRALGARSILADPRSEIMQKQLNLKIKFRESFRPFAPSILEEDLQEWFDLKHESPYMLFVSKVNSKYILPMSKKNEELFGIDKLNIKRSKIPAVTHVDYTARIQTVNIVTNRSYYNLIKKFKEITGCPILLNTSFNIRGEPIVSNVEDAFKCFMGTNLDILVIENCIMFKHEQDKSKIMDYKNEFKLD